MPAPWSPRPFCKTLYAMITVTYVPLVNGKVLGVCIHKEVTMEPLTARPEERPTFQLEH
jgi:hypothetical protein